MPVSDDRRVVEQISEVPAKLACLADVHGNTPALDAVIASPEFAEADAVAFLGCTTGGPDPIGVLERCKSLGLPTYYLAGNGERSLLDLGSGEPVEDWDVGEWLVARHGSEGMATIAAWPFGLSCDVHGLGAVRLCHGSPRSDNELFTPETPVERLREANGGSGANVIVHGHTHLQYDRKIEDLRIVGAGSVGVPYTDGPFGARWTLLGPDVTQIVTPYDIEDVRKTVLDSGYPSNRFMETLERSPNPRDIIADLETKLFSD